MYVAGIFFGGFERWEGSVSFLRGPIKIPKRFLNFSQKKSCSPFLELSNALKLVSCLVWIFPENRKLQFSRRGKENLALLAAHMWVSTYFTILILKLFPKDFPALWWLTQGFNIWIYCASYLESFERYIWSLKQVMSLRSPNHFAKSFWKIIVSKLFCFSIATWDKFCDNNTHLFDDIRKRSFCWIISFY